MFAFTFSKDKNSIISGRTSAATRLGMKRTTRQIPIKKLGIAHRNEVNIPTLCRYVDKRSSSQLVQNKPATCERLLMYV